MKKLLKVALGIVVAIGIAYAGLHIYFAGGENATELPQGKAPTQAQASANADFIEGDLQRLLNEKNGDLLSAHLSRIIEDANDSLKNNKKEVAFHYIENTKTFINTHLNEIKTLKGIDMGLVELFVTLSTEELLNNI